MDSSAFLELKKKKKQPGLEPVPKNPNPSMLTITPPHQVGLILFRPSTYIFQKRFSYGNSHYVVKCLKK
jgi:hypothetical protein